MIDDGPTSGPGPPFVVLALSAETHGVDLGRLRQQEGPGHLGAWSVAPSSCMGEISSWAVT